MNRLIKKANILIEALPYIRTFRGKTVVIKYGGHAMTETALNSMVKKLRLHKVPFAPDEVGTYQWEEIVYRYEHLIELAVALKMLADGMAFRHVVSLLTKYRKVLRKFYREALLESRSERGSDRLIQNPTPKAGEYYGRPINLSELGLVPEGDQVGQEDDRRAVRRRAHHEPLRARAAEGQDCVRRRQQADSPGIEQ